MTLVDAYQQFLADPNSSALADQAALYYVTTTTSVKGAVEIMKHLNGLRTKVKKDGEALLSAVHGQGAIAIELDTTLEFLVNGGPYAPGLDDNFLVDHTICLPIMHVVTFDTDGKIVQIRQTWDQGSLLKQLDVIGRTGRNWPIRNSKEQAKLIATCTEAIANASANQPDTQNQYPDRSRENTGNMRGHKATLSLFGSPDDVDESDQQVVAPKGGIRPKQRDFTDILGEQSEEYGPNTVISPKGGAKPKQRGINDILGDVPVSPGAEQESPSKPKAGAEKLFQPSRLFDAQQDDAEDVEPETAADPANQFKRPHPKKYEHFEFADGSDPMDTVQKGDANPAKNKHSSQWNFDDFVTPQKVKPSKAIRHQDVRHWGTEEDDVQESPIRKPLTSKPRRDAETHFEFVDDGGFVDDDPRPTRPRGATHNNKMGLYENHMYGEEAEEASAEPLASITNLKDRNRDFAAHWNMTDEATTPEPKPKVGEDRKKAVKMMEANWTATDESPSQKENAAADPFSRNADERGINIGGDGMGGKKGSSRDWFFGGGDDEPIAPPKKNLTATTRTGGFNWDF